jgi:hypothetical protein
MQKYIIFSVGVTMSHDKREVKQQSQLELPNKSNRDLTCDMVAPTEALASHPQSKLPHPNSQP